MKYKIIALLSFITIAAGCSLVEADGNTFSDYQGLTKYFRVLSEEPYGEIIYDTRTGVEYWMSYSDDNYGNLTLLVDKDGKPLIYEEEE